MFSTKKTGDRGEEYAAAYLRKHHCKILERNYRKPFGEIDIIARKKNTYLFVEVKTRRCNPVERPIDAVDYRKQQRILRTAMTYIYENHVDADYRCDICEVYIDPETLELLKINYFENAFAPGNGSGY